MTEQQQTLLERIQKLMRVLNDQRLLPEIRGAAYYTMQRHRARLEEQGIETSILGGRIEVTRTLN